MSPSGVTSRLHARDVTRRSRRTRPQRLDRGASVRGFDDGVLAGGDVELAVDLGACGRPAARCENTVSARLFASGSASTATPALACRSYSGARLAAADGAPRRLRRGRSTCRRVNSVSRSTPSSLHRPCAASCRSCSLTIRAGSWHFHGPVVRGRGTSARATSRCGSGPPASSARACRIACAISATASSAWVGSLSRWGDRGLPASTGVCGLERFRHQGAPPVSNAGEPPPLLEASYRPSRAPAIPDGVEHLDVDARAGTPPRPPSPAPRIVLLVAPHG